MQLRSGATTGGTTPRGGIPDQIQIRQQPRKTEDFEVPVQTVIIKGSDALIFFLSDSIRSQMGAPFIPTIIGFELNPIPIHILLTDTLLSRRVVRKTCVCV